MPQSSNDVPAVSLPVPLAALEAFRVVARHPSLTAAAVTLNVTPGALSRRVGVIERWLGTSLFERHGRGLVLTPDGQRLLSRVDAAFALIETAADPWRGRRGVDVVKLSVVPSFARLWLLPRIRELEEGTNGDGRLRIDISVEYRNADLQKGEADMAIRYGLGRWAGADARQLLTETLVPVASATVADRLGGLPTPKQLLAFPLLCDSDAIGWRAWLASQGINRFSQRPHDRRFEDYGAVLAAAEAGLGIALARLPMAEKAIAQAGLVRLSPNLVNSPLNYFVLTSLRNARPATEELATRVLAMGSSAI